MNYQKIAVEIVAKSSEDAIEVKRATQAVLKQKEVFYVVEEVSLFTSTIELCSIHKNSSMGMVFTIHGN
jgi:hypothetical protein